jgi:hypothetical protein
VSKCFFEECKSSFHHEVALNVVAIAWVAARYEHAVCAPPESGKNESGVDSSTAHYAYYSHVCGIFEAACSRKVSAGVTAPVAAES